jgi:hypothetical protein
MPFEPQWARIPLSARWAISLLVAIVLVVLLVRFVDRHSNNSLAHVSQKNLSAEAGQAKIVIGQDQAPVTVHVAAGASAQTALIAGVRRDMNRRITSATIDGPLTGVACGISGHHGALVGYHCLAEAAHVRYPFVAVLTPSAHRVVFCKKDFPPIPSENIPVSARCLL